MASANVAPLGDRLGNLPAAFGESICVSVVKKQSSPGWAGSREEAQKSPPKKGPPNYGFSTAGVGTEKIRKGRIWEAPSDIWRIVLEILPL